MLHGIADLRKDGQGYVYYRDTHVEHFSFSDDAKERDAAWRLVCKCSHLESIGVPVSSATAIWCWSWFADMQADHPLRDFLAQTPEFLQYGFTQGERAARLAAGVPVPVNFPEYNGTIGWRLDDTLWVWDGSKLESRTLVRRDEVAETYYHAAERQGFGTAMMGQNVWNGTCYATLDQIVAWLAKHGITADPMKK